MFFIQKTEFFLVGEQLRCGGRTIGIGVRVYTMQWLCVYNCGQRPTLRREQGDESQRKGGESARVAGMNPASCSGLLIDGGEDEGRRWRSSMKEWKTTISGGETSTNITIKRKQIRIHKYTRIKEIRTISISELRES